MPDGELAVSDCAYKHGGDFLRLAFARTHCAIEVTAIYPGRLSSRPVNASYGRIHGASVVQPHTWWQVAQLAASRIFLRRPILLDVLQRRARLFSEVADKGLNNADHTLLACLQGWQRGLQCLR